MPLLLPYIMYILYGSPSIRHGQFHLTVPIVCIFWILYNVWLTTSHVRNITTQRLYSAMQRKTAQTASFSTTDFCIPIAIKHKQKISLICSLSLGEQKMRSYVSPQLLDKHNNLLFSPL